MSGAPMTPAATSPHAKFFMIMCAPDAGARREGPEKVVLGGQMLALAEVQGKVCPVGADVARRDGMNEYTEQEIKEMYDLLRASRIRLQDENETNDDDFDEDDDEDLDDDEDEDEEEDAEGVSE